MSLARLRAARAVDAPSALVAFVATVAAFASVFVVSARMLLLPVVIPPVDRMTPRETLVYLERPTGPLALVALPPRTDPPPVKAMTTGMPKMRGQHEIRRDPARAASTSPKASALVDPAPIFLPPYRPQPRSTPSPFDLPRMQNPFLAEQPRTRAEIDSMLAELRHGIPLLAATRTATAAERDAVLREQSRARLLPGRAPQMSGGAGMSLSLPLFAAGPSAAERRRDSAANVEYVARLRRLQARVSASRESLRVADSMSRRRTP